MSRFFVILRANNYKNRLVFQENIKT